jgi:hypothetical protein
MRKLRSAKRKSNKKSIRISTKDAANGYFTEADGSPIDPQELLLKKLLPTAAQAFFKELEAEVVDLCGNRYTHGNGAARWCSEGGSV